MTIEYIALALGALSFLISVVALWLAIISDRRMQALSNLEFQEKLATMARHLSNIRQDRSSLGAEQILNDLAAASSLQKYASKEKQEKLIRDYVIPILKEYLSSGMEQGVAITVNRIIDIALSYGIESSELKTLQQHSRGLG
ncbi:MAG: hypothetical protein ACRERV_17230 [Methylococcales bacterium]